MKFHLKIFKSVIPVICLLSFSARAQHAGTGWNSPDQLPGRPAGRFSFVIIGDRTGAGPDSWAVTDRAIDDINRLKPDFAVHIGDVIDGAAELRTAQIQWDEAVRHLDSLRVPLFLVPGNHDIFNPAGAAAWRERFGETFQAFDYGEARFVLLNTEEGISGRQSAVGTQRSPIPDERSGFGPEQLLFLDRALQSNPKVRHIIIFMHQPAWLFPGELKNQWSAAEPKLAGVSCAVFAGHLHLFAEEIRNGNRYCIVGPTGGKLRFSANPTLGLMQHFTRVTVAGDSVRVEFIAQGRTYPESAAIQAFESGLKGFLLLRGKREGW